MRIPKINWPWSKLEDRIDYLQEELKLVQKALMKARVANFLIIEEYTGKITYELPKPISLEKLDKRITKLEKDK